MTYSENKSIKYKTQNGQKGGKGQEEIIILESEQCTLEEEKFRKTNSLISIEFYVWAFFCSFGKIIHWRHADFTQHIQTNR